jgi:hypothetical protein
MKRLRIITTVIAIYVAVTGAAFSAENDQSVPTDKIPANGTLRGNFTHEHSIANSSKTIHSEGHFVVAPNRGILWMVERPIPFNFIVTENGLTQSLGNIPLLQIGIDRMPMLSHAVETISSAVAGDWDTLEKDFIVKREWPLKGWSATIIPRTGNGPVPFRSLTAAGNRHVDSARVLRTDGGFDKFTFFNQKISAAPPTAAELGAFNIAQQKQH